MKTILIYLVEKFLKSMLWNYLMKDVVPNISFDLFAKPSKIDGRQYDQGYYLLKKGDIVATLKEKKFASTVIGGKYSHIAVCIGIKRVDSKVVYEMAEMTKHGYVQSYFYDVCHEADHVDIYRFTKDTNYIHRFCALVRSYEDAIYDNAFEMTKIRENSDIEGEAEEKEELYCSELAYICDVDGKMTVNTEDLAGLGRKYVSPTGLIKNMELIWSADNAPKRLMSDK